MYRGRYVGVDTGGCWLPTAEVQRYLLLKIQNKPVVFQLVKPSTNTPKDQAESSRDPVIE